MKNVTTLGVGFLLLGMVSTGCGGANDPDTMMKKTIGQVNAIAETLADIKDEASAKAALPKLQKIAEASQEMKKKLEGVKATKEQEEALKKKYEKDMQQAVGKLMKESMRVAAVPGGAAALAELQKMK
jgi:hypothetical protein